MPPTGRGLPANSAGSFHRNANGLVRRSEHPGMVDFGKIVIFGRQPEDRNRAGFPAPKDPWRCGPPSTLYKWCTRVLKTDPTCCPVTTATVPGCASSARDSLGPFNGVRALTSAARRSSG